MMSTSGRKGQEYHPKIPRVHAFASGRSLLSVFASMVKFKLHSQESYRQRTTVRLAVNVLVFVNIYV